MSRPELVHPSIAVCALSLAACATWREHRVEDGAVATIAAAEPFCRERSVVALDGRPIDAGYEYVEVPAGSHTIDILVVWSNRFEEVAQLSFVAEPDGAYATRVARFHDWRAGGRWYRRPDVLPPGIIQQVLHGLSTPRDARPPGAALYVWLEDQGTGEVVAGSAPASEHDRD